MVHSFIGTRETIKIKYGLNLEVPNFLETKNIFNPNFYRD